MSTQPTRQARARQAALGNPPGKVSAGRYPELPFFPRQLAERMSQDLHLTGKANRTHEGYLRAVRKLSEYCRTTPDKITTLPEVNTIAQVHQVIDVATNLRMKTYFWTVYSLGLRLNKALHLQVGDIDSARGMVHVHRGKGAKDRYLPLPTSTLKILRTYWATHRHPCLLFPADGRNHTLRPGAISDHRIRHVDANSVTYDYVPSKCPRPKCPTCRGTMEVKEIVFQAVWLEQLNTSRPARPPPVINSS